MSMPAELYQHDTNDETDEIFAHHLEYLQGAQMDAIRACQAIWGQMRLMKGLPDMQDIMRNAIRRKLMEARYYKAQLEDLRVQ